MSLTYKQYRFFYTIDVPSVHEIYDIFSVKLHNAYNDDNLYTEVSRRKINFLQPYLNAYMRSLTNENSALTS